MNSIYGVVTLYNPDIEEVANNINRYLEHIGRLLIWANSPIDDKDALLDLLSIYSQRLFEILKSWSDKPEVELTVLYLKTILEVPKSMKNFAEFRRRVLEKAHNDITKYTSLRFEWEPIKKGRSVESVRFIFAKKKAFVNESRSFAGEIAKAEWLPKDKRNVLLRGEWAPLPSRPALLSAPSPTSLTQTWPPGPKLNHDWPHLSSSP